MTSISGFYRHTAIFFDKFGEYCGSAKIESSFKQGTKKKSFSFNNSTYLTNKNCSRFLKEYFLYDEYLYIYDIDNVNPKKLGSSPSKISPADVNVLLKSDMLAKLNNVRKGDLMALLTPRNIMFGILGIVVLGYFLSGGSLINSPVDNSTIIENITNITESSVRALP